ncbi:MAG TPA: hypothetical protein VF198_12320 [Vicinamibacterales bacterium]
MTEIRPTVLPFQTASRAWSHRLFATVLVALLAASAPRAAESPDQRALASQLAGAEFGPKTQALSTVARMAPETVGPELRAVLIAELEREAQLVTSRYWAPRRNLPLAPLDDPEYIVKLAEVVAMLKDPQAIPALAHALGLGFVAITPLVEFGEPAVPAVLDVALSLDSSVYAVNDALIALRMMVERQRDRPLSPGTLAAIRDAARLHLIVKQPFFETTMWAIDLAVALDDPTLRRIVQAIAANPAEARARGALEPEDVLLVQTRANERLSGVPPIAQP